MAVGLGAIFLATREPDMLFHVLVGVGLLLVSVIIHELGHTLAALRLGSSVEHVVLGPVGGMVPVGQIQDPHRDLLIALAGPVANMLVCLALAPLLYFCWNVDLIGLLKNPFNPQDMMDGAAWLVALKIACWLNWSLVLVNSLPAFPLDNGRVLRDILWPSFEFRPASLAVSRVSKVTALALIVLGYLIEDPKPFTLMTAWFPLGMLALFIFFSSRQESERVEENEVEDDLFGYDFSQGYTSLEQAHGNSKFSMNGLRSWLEKRRLAKETRRREIEAEEERRVDGILARLHSEGMNALSMEERNLLDRVSARYRNRQRAE
jgi:Zn-dependent protease